MTKSILEVVQSSLPQGPRGYSGSQGPAGGYTGSVGYTGSQGDIITELNQNRLTNDSYTIDLTDRAKHIYCANTTSDTTIYIPTSDTTDFPIGSSSVIVTNTGRIATIAAANSTVTTVLVPGIAYSFSGYVLPFQTVATVLKIDTDTWMLSGYGITGV